MTESYLPTRLKRLRVANGISQEQMAEALGLHSSAISRIEKGERKLLAHEFIAWAKACGTTSDAVANGRMTVVIEDEKSA